MTEKAKKSFILYADFEDILLRLSLKERGVLFSLIYSYVNRGVVDELPVTPQVDVIFAMVRAQLDRDKEKYEETCKRNSENGRKGGRPKKTEEKTDRFFSKPKKADTDTDTDTDTDNDNDTVIDIDTETDNESGSPAFAEGKDSDGAKRQTKEEKRKGDNFRGGNRTNRSYRGYRGGYYGYGNNSGARDFSSESSMSSFDAEEFFEAALRRSYSDTD